MWLVFGYGALGAALGAAAALVVALASRLVRRRTIRWLLATGVVAVVGLAPLVYLLLLPDLGLGIRWLTHLLAAGGLRRILLLAGCAAALSAAGWVLAFVLRAVARRWGVRARAVLAAAWISGALGLVSAVGPGSTSGASPVADPRAAELPPASGPPPAPVVLLCVDGADLDDVILPLVGAGDLPTFARLMREGTWGPLATFEPTLSPVVWTTLITGKPPAAHGIRHFLHFRLPGVRGAIYQFPLHTGLNFHLFPLLEKVPGMPEMRAPYTSNLRRVEALWNIVGRRYRVGVYRWLLSWPAEAVNGFSVAGGIGWVQFDAEARRKVDATLREEESLSGGAFQPPELRRLLDRGPAPAVSDEAIAAYVGAGHAIDRHDRRLRPILHSVGDPTSHELPALIARFGVRFAAAGFYPVDAFHHFFGRYRGRGGIFSNAVDQRYRFTDARLGELLAALPADTRLIVVSDHGFDFEHNHHTYAPAGVFFARGPGFDAGRRVDGLSVYDIAPLVLRLLDMPLPDDMPGALSGGYRAALAGDFLASRPATRIATYESPEAASFESVPSPKDEEIREVLKSLGYIE